MRDKGYSVVESRDGGSLEKLSLPAMICILSLFCAAAGIAAPAQRSFTTLVNFNGANGAYPVAGLVQATDGNLYSTTSGGNGTVFKITPSGTLTTLYIFTHGADGGDPEAGLVQGTDGNFYGTTYGGGGGNCYGLIGCGTVFKITPAGTLTTLYSFTGYSDGGNSLSTLVQGRDGNFYGTTFGVTTSGSTDGTVFKITPSGTFTTLHAFGGWDGAGPCDELVQGSDGNFYGTTTSGGSNGAGTFFRMTPSGTLTTLYNFCSLAGCADGQGPLGALVQASAGNFYGTGRGGVLGHGTVFKITPSGTLTTLYNFGADLNNSDGVGPVGGLVQAADGNFYGTTSNGGGSNNCVAGCGTVFTVTATGKLTTLHRFDGTDGGSPFAGLVQATNGYFYGTTSGVGTYNNDDGTVFRLGVVYPCATCRP
jgi:uncharacterized repeat protein (TIGR03803 family)